MRRCPRPHFPFNAQRGWYEACTRCGRTAWAHEQADMVADLRSTAAWMRAGAHGPPPPPVMKP